MTSSGRRPFISASSRRSPPNSSSISVPVEARLTGGGAGFSMYAGAAAIAFLSGAKSGCLCRLSASHFDGCTLIFVIFAK